MGVCPIEKGVWDPVIIEALGEGFAEIVVKVGCSVDGEGTVQAYPTSDKINRIEK